MRLASFVVGERSGFGFLIDDRTIVDLCAAGLAPDLEAFVARGSSGVAQARDVTASAPRHAVERVAFTAPFPQPTHTIMCVGKNYREHAAEFHDSGFDSTAGASAVPDEPIVFVKHPSSVVASGTAIESGNDPTQTVDYEGELGVVIGDVARRVSRADAMQHVYGFTIANDVTSRTLQSKHKQWFIGKSVDTFCPMGPYLVTADEVRDVRELRLQTFVNGELRQNATVADLIFDIPTLIAAISATTTLVPGDIILTGTPAGVGIGFAPPKFLVPGDVVRITIDGLGELTNPVR